ncbi:MAG: carboxymuconolactone decarboxylase family protein [Gemmatimonadota bacterium]
MTPLAPLSPEDQLLLTRVTGSLASRSHEALRCALLEARNGLPALAVEEALVQSYLFLGYPAALNGLALWREVQGEEGAPPATVEPPHPWDAWTRRGEEVCQAVYGEQYERLRQRVRGLHPDLERWMVTEGYGKVLGRPGLTLADREVAVVALLAVLDVPVQLRSHLRGALRAGVSPTQLEAVLQSVSAFQDDEVERRSDEVWQLVHPRRAT